MNRHGRRRSSGDSTRTGRFARMPWVWITSHGNRSRRSRSGRSTRRSHGDAIATVSTGSPCAAAASARPPPPRHSRCASQPARRRAATMGRTWAMAPPVSPPPMTCTTRRAVTIRAPRWTARPPGESSGNGASPTGCPVGGLDGQAAGPGQAEPGVERSRRQAHQEPEPGADGHRLPHARGEVGERHGHESPENPGHDAPQVGIGLVDIRRHQSFARPHQHPQERPQQHEPPLRGELQVEAVYPQTRPYPNKKALVPPNVPSPTPVQGFSTMRLAATRQM